MAITVVMDTDMAMAHVRKKPDAEESGLPQLRLSILAAIVIAGLAAGGASAQTVRVTPTVTSSITWTDNVGASARDDESDWIAEVSPGLSIARDSGRFNGQLNAQLRNIGHASETDRNKSFLQLQGRGQVEAVEDAFFIDMDAAISRNNLSAFTGRSASDTLNTDKESETRTWSVAPRLDFRLWGDTEGSLSYLSRWLDSGGSVLGQQRLGRWTLRVGDPSAFKYIGWGVDYSRSDSDYGSATSSSGSSRVMSEVGRATLYIRVTPQFRLRAIAGHESNEYEVQDGESGPIYGAGLDWNPTERTAISATVEDRVFGTGYDFSLEHRMARSSWFASYGKDVTSSIESLSQGPLTQEELLCAQIAVLVTEDPDQREQVYRNCLAALGFDPFVARQTVVSNAHYVIESLQAGFSIIGVRNSVTVSFLRSDRTLLGSAATLVPGDDFARTDRMLTTALTLAFSHRLSALSTLNLTLNRTRSEGASASGLDTRRLYGTVSLTRKLGPHTVGSLTFRHQRADGVGSDADFTENAVIASIGIRF